jgi:mRNA-degrading endonuclease HigB of HigAB toxin-antitoxin module
VKETNLFFRFVKYLSDYESSDSIEKALSKRITFVFDDEIIMNISGNGRLIAFVKKTESHFFQSHWNYLTDVETWEFTKPINENNINKLMTQFALDLGTPEVYLPWREYFDSLSELFDDDPEMIENGELFEEVQKILRKTQISFVKGTDFLPPKSDFARFMKVMNQLEQENWLILWDECCWTCAKSNIESQQSLDDPYFIIYGQNSDDFFTPEGALRGIMFKPHAYGKNREVELALDYGFEVRKDSNGLIKLGSGTK